TKFPQVDSASAPFTIVRGPEDNLWFTRDDGRVSRLTVDGRLDDIVRYQGVSANGLAVGPDGALWITVPSAHRIGRVSSLPFDFINIADSGPMGFAPGLGGSIWFTDLAANRVAHVSRGGGLIQYELGETHGPGAIAAAPDGGAFFT